MKIAMIGTGYVGLVSGVCFSDFGHDVICVDKNTQKIAMLKNGEVPIFEPGLDALLARNIQAGRLSFTDDLAAAVAESDAVFIAVGTPTRRGPALCGPGRRTGRRRRSSCRPSGPTRHRIGWGCCPGPRGRTRTGWR